MKTVFISLATLLITGAAQAAENCYRFYEGNTEVTIGWFKKKTFTADSFCIEGKNIFTQAYSDDLKLTFKKGANVLAQYDARSEVFPPAAGKKNATIRFTLSDGEPEPTQIEGILRTWNNQTTLVSVTLNKDGLTELGSGGKFECKEINGTRDLTLKQIDKTTAWQLTVKDGKKKVVNSILTVDYEEDVNFNLKNEADQISFKIYLDELYVTYLMLPGATESVNFDCQGE